MFFFLSSDGMEREACVCDHGYERSDLCAEIIIIIRQRTWLAMGRDKEDRERDRVSDGQRERERNIIWLLC